MIRGKNVVRSMKPTGRYLILYQACAIAQAKGRARGPFDAAAEVEGSSILKAGDLFLFYCFIFTSLSAFKPY
jgi:hypothetical protein